MDFMQKDYLFTKILTGIILKWWVFLVIFFSYVKSTYPFAYKTIF
jgi:hypothetical protein